ncbi:SUKH-3 domain-containing protein [Actinoplanes derwentensis]|uniref:SUKH-3 domain-containing protein n=1 Tax=Actinoplanes derwentensis TaxID=113562 RepID=UPI000B889FF8|nr:SUKH-3 domain-containing protein [Actinoplanes derwentensis]GID89861.1 hypothetical protein Ade03nite_87850 [Actinoplanes derwentensis]
MKRLSEEAIKIVAKAGWFPGRHIDISAWRASFQELGLVMHEAAENFLSEFGGLSFEYDDSEPRRAIRSFEFDPLLGCGEEGRFEDWGNLIEVKLFPIGELDFGVSFIAIGDDAVLYLVADWLARFGDGVDGVDNMIIGMHPEILYNSYPI